VGKWGKKWPESELAVQMPCNPVTLCRNLRTLEGLKVSQCPVHPILYAAIAVYDEPPVALREQVTRILRVNFPAKLPGFVSQSPLGSVPNEGPDLRITSPAFCSLLYASSNHGTGNSSWVASVGSDKLDKR
jgi:hypothetical protein